MLDIGIVIATLFCAFQVMRAERLMFSTIWLALSSALVAVLLFRMGAHEVAVIELSVGAGLVTVLFVFAFSIVGEATLDAASLVPRLLVWVTILAGSVLLGALTLPLQASGSQAAELPFAAILWEQRGPDVLAQIALIFAGVIGVVGLLTRDAPARVAALPLVQAGKAPIGSPAAASAPNGRHPDTLEEKEEAPA